MATGYQSSHIQCRSHRGSTSPYPALPPLCTASHPPYAACFPPCVGLHTTGVPPHSVPFIGPEYPPLSFRLFPRIPVLFAPDSIATPALGCVGLHTTGVPLFPAGFPLQLIRNRRVGGPLASCVQTNTFRPRDITKLPRPVCDFSTIDRGTVGDLHRILGASCILVVHTEGLGDSGNIRPVRVGDQRPVQCLTGSRQPPLPQLLQRVLSRSSSIPPSHFQPVTPTLPPSVDASCLTFHSMPPALPPCVGLHTTAHPAHSAHLLALGLSLAIFLPASCFLAIPSPEP